MKRVNQVFFEQFRMKSTRDEEFDDGNQSRTYLDKAGKWIYFLLASESEGKCYRLEFWIDTYADNRWELQKKLREYVQNNLRTHELVSYYSALGCRLRIRTTEGALVNDVTTFYGDICRAVLDGVPKNCPAVEECDSCEAPLSLPCACPLKSIASMLEAGTSDKEQRCKNKNRLEIPPVQRGKVWNAVRCATLWDSILRGYAIGSLSVKRNADGAFDLLDGQQRSTAISLGYCSYPPPLGKELDSVLWIDLNPRGGTECQYEFYVTTASQPWGYELSLDETKNSRLKTDVVRRAIEKIVWTHPEQKPYPAELYPIRANCPVPFTLLRQYVEQNSDATIEDFVQDCRTLGDGSCYNWLQKLDLFDKEKVQKDLVSAIRQLDRYSVQVCDAGNVTAEDVALYFRRIGRGGVMPSAEELAYSVLKAKIGSGFRNAIEGIVEDYGLDKACRVASVAVRLYFLKNGEFIGNAVLDKVIRMERDGTIGDFRTGILNFVGGGNEFKKLIEDVNSALKEQGFTSWHVTRYCQSHNGDVYLFLLSLAGPNKDLLDKPIADGGIKELGYGGVAELLSWYAQDTAYVIRKILAKGKFREAIVEAMNESHYGSVRMNFPLDPSLYGKLMEICRGGGTVDSCEEFRENNPDAANLISSGYGNEAAYSKLLFACNATEPNGMFKYNKCLGVWAEDNCPWDYDHILPRSWVDNLPRTLRDKYSWLVNSIGNLAPLPFSLNRHLSDDSRDANYPSADESGKAQRQCLVKVEGLDGTVELDVTQHIEDMGTFRAGEKNSELAFYKSTILRFDYIYRSWYERNGFGSFFDLGQNDGLLSLRKMLLMKMHEMLGVQEMCGLVYEDHNGSIKDLMRTDSPIDWYVRNWLGIRIKTNDVSIECWMDRSGRVEIGVCGKSAECSDTSKYPLRDDYWAFYGNRPCSDQSTEAANMYTDEMRKLLETNQKGK